MKYQVLARKYRPKTFTSMMGQEHVLKALSNALDSERLHHAYLFTGTRGVGKTTVARVLAKALNCEKGISALPCGECPACQEIEQGRFVDLIEVDAASRTKVEDTRELLDNVQYAPTRGRFKIYLIDEVHMLSGHSFNALLKTLEEPPPHVKFLLATTDPQKLPVTILSRCLQFNLKRLNIEQIEQQLEQILNSERINFDPNALKPLAIAADGSMRDALSLLDQAIAYSNGQPNLADVEAMLGSVQKDRIFDLLTALANEDGKRLIEQSRILTGQGIDVNTILAELITTLQRIALCQMVPEAIDDSLGDKNAIEQMSQAITPEDIQLYYQIALNGRKDLPYSPQPQGGFEMVLLRMLAFKPVNSGQKQSTQAPQIQKTTPQIQTQAQQIKKANQSEQIVSEPAPITANNNSASSDSVVISEKKTSEHAKLKKNQSIGQTGYINQPDTEIVKLDLETTEAQNKAQTQPESAAETPLLNNIPDEMDLPPIDAYGQEDFQQPSEQNIPLFDDVPVIATSETPMAYEDDSVSEVAQFSNKKPENQKGAESSVDTIKAPSDPTDNKIVSVPDIACEESGILADFWHDLIKRSGIKGLEQQLAKHCALVKKSEKNGEQYFELLLESVHKHLLNDKILGRLVEALQPTIELKVHLDIKECQVKRDPQLQTPRRREIHEAEVLQQQAVESIASDPKVKLLVEAFGATVREETIKPIP